MTSTDIAYDVDGSTMIGRLALPDGEGTRPAVLIAHEGNGLDDFQKTRPDRFAELGYVAFALDYYGAGRPLDSRDEINARLSVLYDDVELTRRIAAPASTCCWRSHASIRRRSRRSATASAGHSCSNSLAPVPTSRR